MDESYKHKLNYRAQIYIKNVYSALFHLYKVEK